MHEDRKRLALAMGDVPELPEYCKDRCQVMGGCAATALVYLNKTSETDGRVYSQINQALSGARTCANVRTAISGLTNDPFIDLMAMLPETEHDTPS